jgi:thioredoxin reductase (NADPH)
MRLPGIDPLVGAGVYYGAAVTEASSYRGQPVVVVGGANSAGMGAMLMSQYASRVSLVVRRGWLDMSKYLRDQLQATLGSISVGSMESLIPAFKITT